MYALVDGNNFKPYINRHGDFVPHKCFAQGDTKYYSIAAASMMLNQLGEEKYANDIENAIISTAQKLDSLSAGKMGMSTSEVGDTVLNSILNN